MCQVSIRYHYKKWNRILFANVWDLHVQKIYHRMYEKKVEKVEYLFHPLPLKTKVNCMQSGEQKERKNYEN